MTNLGLINFLNKYVKDTIANIDDNGSEVHFYERSQLNFIGKVIDHHLEGNKNVD